MKLDISILLALAAAAAAAPTLYPGVPKRWLETRQLDQILDGLAAVEARQATQGPQATAIRTGAAAGTVVARQATQVPRATNIITGQAAGTVVAR
ncbi:hypothetical protein FB567DRAFT_591403 [Paraphoma chrysanthemicola]|uniref:Uncharacterized protein n=1 Tax=Paraphoma chrysanthemicola TaxID=798071 RepID=A0A8K0R9C0_9PLEO|nr:hypothetical protein FB567DRAFT_591403 [Paraphoma chrysanthemicola]